MKRCKLFTGAALVLAIAAPVRAGVTWDFRYEANSAWTDGALAAERQSVLEDAGNYLSTFLTAYDATIVMDVDDNTTTPGTLAAASSNFHFAPTAGFVEMGDIQRKILTGVDPAPGLADGNVTWNFTNVDWELGTDFQPDEFDFLSTAIHELVHALGFSSEILQEGNDGYGNAPKSPGDPGSPGNWSPFDEFLTDFAGTAIIDPATFIVDKALWDLASLSQDGTGVAGCDAGLLFGGPNTKAANGGEAAQIYSPGTWEGGSSGSHLDDNCYTPSGTSTYMEEASTVDGLGIRVLSDLEVGMMRDIGYTQFGVSSPTNGNVPVAPVLYLMIPALGMLGFSRRNKKA